MFLVITSQPTTLLRKYNFCPWNKALQTVRWCSLFGFWGGLFLSLFALLPTAGYCWCEEDAPQRDGELDDLRQLSASFLFSPQDILKLWCWALLSAMQ